MEILPDIEALGDVVGVVDLAIGVFDGVHLGHREVIGAAAAGGGEPAVLTFDPHPIRLLRPDLAPLELTGLEHKARLLAQLGVRYLLPLKFDQGRAQQSAEDFLREIAAAARISRVAVGAQFRFGHERGGDIELLKRMGTEFGFEASGVAPVRDEAGEVISSTRVRGAIASGDLDLAAALLGREYSIFGRVKRGKQLGNRIGFPTANISRLPGQLPPFGVYAVQAQFGAEMLSGVANLGVRPTVEGEGAKPVLEAHFFDFEGDLYDEQIEVEFKAAIRPERKFAGLDELRKQIANDLDTARALLAGQ